MSDPVEAIAAQLRALERQVRALATSARAPHTSVQSGSTRWLGEDGAEKVHIGTSDGTSGSVLRVLNDDGSARVLLIESGEMRAPIGTASWMRDMNRPIDTNGRPLTSAPTYETLWTAIVFASAKRMSFNLTLGLNTGVTSAEARLSAFSIGYYNSDSDVQAADGGTQTMREWTGITSTSVLDAALIPFPDSLRDPPASAVGSVVQLWLQARRQGSGSVWLDAGPMVLS